jgi:hypothetical protein
MYDNVVVVHIIPYALHTHTHIYIYIYQNHEGMPFMTFVRRSLYPWGNNASKDEGH